MCVCVRMHICVIYTYICRKIPKWYLTSTCKFFKILKSKKNLTLYISTCCWLASSSPFKDAWSIKLSVSCRTRNSVKLNSEVIHKYSMNKDWNMKLRNSHTACFESASSFLVFTSNCLILVFFSSYCCTEACSEASGRDRFRRNSFMSEFKWTNDKSFLCISLSLKGTCLRFLLRTISNIYDTSDNNTLNPTGPITAFNDHQHMANLIPPRTGVRPTGHCCCLFLWTVCLHTVYGCFSAARDHRACKAENACCLALYSKRLQPQTHTLTYSCAPWAPHAWNPFVCMYFSAYL